jgi:hypothetical protein
MMVASIEKLAGNVDQVNFRLNIRHPEDFLIAVLKMQMATQGVSFSRRVKQSLLRDLTPGEVEQILGWLRNLLSSQPASVRSRIEEMLTQVDSETAPTLHHRQPSTLSAQEEPEEEGFLDFDLKGIG